MLKLASKMTSAMMMGVIQYFFFRITACAAVIAQLYPIHRNFFL